MPIGRAQFIAQFEKQALDSRISLFLGAGGSCDVGYPNWADLFAPLAQELQISTSESTDYYQLAQYYVNNFGSAALRQKINERINRNHYQSELLSGPVTVITAYCLSSFQIFSSVSAPSLLLSANAARSHSEHAASESLRAV